MVRKEENTMSYQTLTFEAMGCPCEILLDSIDPLIGTEQRTLAMWEVFRIERKYSRYQTGNIIEKINTADGAPVEVDAETAALLDYAARCYDLSGGLFDVTTGALRKGADLPAGRQAPSNVGWNLVRWEKPFLTMPPGFEIDLGGICKEYAADRILNLLVQRHPISTLVNLGGDIVAAGDKAWSVGIEDATKPGQVVQTIYLKQGAVATSGTARRGGHILNPKTGRPVEQSPASVTVATKTCTEAGFWSTLAVLQGNKAESFLKDQGLEYWCYPQSSSSSH
jgi:thiamine biosynthesis lipoprotein